MNECMAPQACSLSGPLPSQLQLYKRRRQGESRRTGKRKYRHILPRSSSLPSTPACHRRQDVGTCGDGNSLSVTPCLSQSGLLLKPGLPRASVSCN